MSLKIDEYISSIGALSELMKQQTISESAATSKTGNQDTDTYVSTIGNGDESIPCENYNDILNVIRKSKAETVMAEETSEETQQTVTVSGTGGSGGSGGSSESEEETTTKIVVINGVTYQETTTVTDGVTSIQRTVISGGSGNEEN